MSQNQSYFWHTTRHNVYLKRSAKLHMLLALMAVMTFSTICMAEISPRYNDENGVTMGAPTLMPAEGGQKIDDILGSVGGNEVGAKDPPKETKSGNGFIDAFTASISVILFTELGDKTFFIAAIMAMRHPRLIVFTGAITALALMTVLSVGFGMAATIIPKVYTYYISTALFAIFGLKMIYEGYFMKDSDTQEELEEVQSDLRKREDELLRATRGKYDDGAEGKRKNSNSDKEDAGGEGGAGAAAAHSSPAGALPALKANPEMQHRHRKQLNNNNSSNKNKNNNNNNNMNGCEPHHHHHNNDNNDDDDVDVDYNDDACTESDVFLNGDRLQLATYRSSPALSSSAQSNHTEQTNCDEFINISSPAHKPSASTSASASASPAAGQRNGPAMVHSASASAAVTPHKDPAGALNAMNSISSASVHSLAGAGCAAAAAVGAAGAGAGQPNGELKQLGGSKKRLERDVSATNVQDPESGIVRKNTKKSAAYLTTRVLMQAFTMTFLAEWGDRSQLTTIILATSKNVYGIIVGGIIGHSICTGLAVIGGRIVAAKISVRTVTILGGIVFLGFALYALIVRPDDI